MTSNPDQLLSRARSFDQKALARIYDLYSQELYAYTYKHTGSAQIAEDLVADTFQRFLGALQKGGGPETHLRGYLYRITHNLITDFYRQEPAAPQQLEPERLAANDPLPPEEAARRQAAERIRQALRQITPEQRQVVALRFLEGWRSAEIARLMNKSIGAVKALQHRGLAALERILEREGLD